MRVIVRQPRHAHCPTCRPAQSRVTACHTIRVTACHTSLAIALGFIFIAAHDGLAQIPASPSAGLVASPEPGWPQWRGPKRDGVSQEKGLLPQWPAGGPKLLWKAEALGKGWSSPIVVNHRVYITGDVGNDLVLYCFDDRGANVWKTTNGQAWNGSYPGARASCVYSQSRIYLVNAHGRLACFDAAGGNEIWDIDILQRFEAKNIQWGITECLLVDGERLFVTPGGAKALAAALDKNDGHTLWTTPALGKDQTSHSSPILVDAAGRRQLLNCSSTHGFAVDAADGKLLWTVPLKNQFGVNTSTPIVGGDLAYFVTPYGERGRAYRMRRDGDRVAADEAWRTSLDTVTGTGVLTDGVLWSAGYRTSKWWFGVDWQSGKTLCELKDLTTGAAVWADGRLYVLDENGTVALARADRDGMTLVGRFRIDPKARLGDAWAHPVLCDGRLYIRYHDTLWCYDVRAR